MGMRKHDLAGNYLAGNVNVDLSQKRPKSQLPWFYCGKSTAVSPDNIDLIFVLSPNLSKIGHRVYVAIISDSSW